MQPNDCVVIYFERFENAFGLPVKWTRPQKTITAICGEKQAARGRDRTK
jgi:hypothetical protein